MDNIELSNGAFVKCKSLTFSEFEALRLIASEGLIEKFRKQFDVEAYRLNNQEIIASEGGYYMLFENTSDLEQVLKDNHSTHGTEILNNKNPYGKEFPKQTDALIKELTESLSVNYVQVDEQLLKELDNKITRLPNGSEFKKKKLINLIAVIGEVLIQKNKIEWKMVLSSDGKTWNPYLQSNTRTIKFFIDLYEDIYIKRKNGSSLLELYETIVL